MNIIKQSSLNIKFILWPLAILLACVLALLINHYGRIQIGGFDDSILINTAYELHLGYKPYVDVVTGWPPIMLIGCQIAFSLFGIHWYSLVIITAIFSALTFILQMEILERIGFPLWLSLIVSFAIQTVTNLVISWWWYNQITAVLGVLFLSSALLFYRQCNDFFGKMILVISMTLLLLSKPNIAGVLFVFVTGLFLSIRKLHHSYLLLLGLSLGSSVVILWLYNISITSLLNSYIHYAESAFTIKRAINFMWFNYPVEAMQTFWALAPIMTGALIGYLESKKIGAIRNHRNLYQGQFIQGNQFDPSVAIGMLAIAVGFWGLVTNNDFNMNEASYMIFGCVVLVSTFLQKIQRSLIRSIFYALVVTSIIALTVNGIMYTTKRLRVAGIGPFYENSPLTVAMSPSLFQGILIGPRLTRVLSDMKSILNETGYKDNPDAPVFFGPRIDFGYAAFGIHPYPGLPTWWEFFSQDHTKQTDIMVERFKNADFRMCVFLMDDFTFLPKSLISYLNDAYQVRQQGELIIFTKR